MNEQPIEALALDPFAKALAEAAAAHADDGAHDRYVARERAEQVRAWWAEVSERLPSGFDAIEFEAAAREREDVRTTVEVMARWNPLGSEWRLIAGPTGVGKTWSVVARLHAALAYLRGVAELPARLPWVVWTREADVVEAARHHRLGAGEAPLLEALKGRSRYDKRGVPYCDDRSACDLAIIDEAGYCGDVEALRRVLDVRYGSKKATVVTTGLRLDGPGSFGERYGGALMRRLVENKHVIDLHGKQS